MDKQHGDLSEYDNEYNLAKSAQSGDKSALETLLLKLRGPFFALAYTELRHYDDAQDAVANAVLRICRHIHTLKKPETVRAWMFRIVQNEARRLRNGRVNLAPLLDDTEAANANEAGDTILRADIEKALRRLPRQQARALWLFYLDDLPVRTIAAHLSRPEGTIKYWLHRGRQTLSEEMKDYAMTTKPVSDPPLTATIISTDFAPEMLAQMTTALQTAGWNAVQTRTDFADLGSRLPADGEPPRDPLWNSSLLVLDEWINGRSVFEVLPLLRGKSDAQNIAIFLLINGDRDEKSKNLTVLSAYVSGVDMLLTKPFNLLEFEAFARRIRHDFAPKKP